ncbi:MAG TPA: FAD-linked oxidase C-terminal domain-containing protein, partial [Solirubrobacteraceae bacterium]|nr:FAD-linked oxidase C-terminal domain-containing protein [Solirubrobacteraceae bacterium]
RHGGRDLRVAQDEPERQLLWKTRKAAFPAAARISPHYFVQDGVIPRTQLPEVLRRIDALAAEYDMQVATCSTPATATCTRSSATRARRTPRAPRSSPGASSPPASSSAAR